MGKSTLAARLIHLWQADIIFIYDWQEGEFADRLGAFLCTTPAEVAHRIEQGQRIICYDPQIEMDDDYEEKLAANFKWWCKMVMEVCSQLPGEKLVVVDENHDLQSAYKLPSGQRWLVTKGRRKRINTILMASGANGLHNTVRNNLSELYCFRCTDENALEYPASLGIDKEQIKTLPKTHFLHRDRATGEVKKLALWDEESNGS